MGRKKTNVETQKKEVSSKDDIISDEIRKFVNEKQYSSTISIKTYLDSRLQAHFSSLESKLRDFVNEKYEVLHDRGYMKSEVALSREDVLQTVELVVSNENIDQNIDLYMNELKKLRFKELEKYNYFILTYVHRIYNYVYIDRYFQ